MAAQAEDFALSLAEPGSDTWRAVTLFVRRSIDAWRGSLRAYDRHAGGAGSAPAVSAQAAQLCDPWELARRNFPHVDDATGRLATRLLHEFGIRLLGRTRKPWDHIIVLAVLRHAARVLRGELSESGAGLTRETAVSDILAVQSYAEKSGLAPMLAGYSGRGRLALQALGLMRDARTVRDAVREAGEEDRAAMWQRAIDFHAFAVVALEHGMLLELPMDEAYEVAAAAIRLETAARTTPDLVELPSLPEGSASTPDVVRLHASACLPPQAADGSQ